MNIGITFQKGVYFKVKVLLAHLLLAIALGMTLLKEKKKGMNIFN